MTESPEDYELFHYGVKGMKWGVRKSVKKGAVRTLKAYTPTKQSEAKARAQQILNRNGGNKTKAIAKTVASTVGKQVVLGFVAGKTVLAVPVASVPVVGVATVGSLSVAAKGAQDIYNISRSKP